MGRELREGKGLGNGREGKSIKGRGREVIYSMIYLCIYIFIIRLSLEFGIFTYERISTFKKCSPDS